MADSKNIPSPYARYGSLNDINKPVVSPRIDLQQTSVIGIMRNAVNADFMPNATLGTGPYKGICLRAEEPASQAGSWASRAWAFAFGTESNIALQQIKVRIPEIHAALPIPSALGTEDPVANQTIDMYPTFIAQTSDNSVCPRPNPGDIVWVDFGNKQNFTDPIYVRIAIAGKSVPGVAGVSGQGAHAGACVGNMNLVKPSGDALSGKNVSLSHTGLPLLPRKPGSVVSGGNRTITGPRFSVSKLAQWNMAMSKGVPGVTWFGGMMSNGAEDIRHPQGKRDTVIFAPNTTDFSAPVELMYFFHGSAEFGDKHDFSGRFVSVIKKLSAAGRNFVLVIPELFWSADVPKPYWRRYSTAIWQGRDNFANFHLEVLKILKENFSSKVNIGFVSITAHSAGGSALMAAAKAGQLDTVKPQKITFADATYDPFAQVVWDLYGSKNKVEFNILTGTGKSSIATNEMAQRLVKKAGKDKIHYEQLEGKNHQQVGDYGLLFVNQSNSKILGEIKDIEVDNAKKNPPSEQEIADSEPMSAGTDEEQKKKNGDKTLKQPGAKVPPPHTSDTSPSAVAKSSGTKKKSSAIIKPAQPFTEARVRVDDYAPLPENSPLLVSIASTGNGPQKAHKLLVARWDMMNMAWLSENPGGKDLTVSSGWRKRDFATEEEYNKAMLDPNGKWKYKSLEEAHKKKAWKSAHETGLAIDLHCNGIVGGKFAVNEQSKQTQCYRWLKENAYKYGFSPYQFEAWHWECRLPYENWLSGEEFVTDNDYAVTVAHPGEKTGMPSPGYSQNQPCVLQLGQYQEANKK